MSLRSAVRAIIVHEGALLVIRRSKPNGQKYMVTPGGRMEEGEDQLTTLRRELAEETMVTVSDPRLVFIEEPNDGTWGTQYIYVCTYQSGTPQLHPESEEVMIQAQGGGTYEPLWLPFAELANSEYPFRSVRLGQEIAMALENGFPDEPIQWTL